MTKHVNLPDHHISFTPRRCSDAVSSLLLDLHLMIVSVKAPPLTAQLPPILRCPSPAMLARQVAHCCSVNCVDGKKKKKMSSRPEIHHPVLKR